MEISLETIKEIITQMNFTNVGWQIIAPLLFMAGDFISGFIQACINNNISTKIMRQGILRKALLLLVITLSFVIQYCFNLSVISKVVCAYIIIMEFISILENIKKAGVDLGKLGQLIKDKK